MLLSFSIEPLVAQNDDVQLYLINSVKVQPSKVVAYEKAVNNFNASMRTANVNSIEYYANATANYEYHYALPIDNMAQLDKSYFGAAIKKIGEEKFRKEIAAMDACKVEEVNAIYAHVKAFDYSHASLKDTEMNFRKWDVYECKPGTEDQVYALAAEWKALLKKHDIVRRHAYYFEAIGPKVGTLIVVTDAKDQATYAQQQQQLFEKTGAEGLALWRKTEALMLDVKHRTGRFRLDLSVIPTVEKSQPVVAEKE